MRILKPYTKKLLKDLDNPDLWEEGLFSLQNKEHKFEIGGACWFPAVKIWNYPQIEFNIIEKYLICGKMNQILSIIRKKEHEEKLKKELPDYFKT